MKERGTLFNPDMSRAALADLKTQTRRGMSPQPPEDCALVCGIYHPTVIDRRGDEQPGPERFGVYSTNGEWSLPCPYGQPGDRIYVKETFYAFGRWETRFSAKKGRDEWHFVDLTIEQSMQYRFEAPDGYKQAKKRRAGALPTWHRRPSLFMPRVAARTILEVTAVRVERLQAISQQDAMAEGYALPPPPCLDDPRNWYRRLWDQINGAGSWDANPWVWVISFKRLISDNKVTL